MLCHKAEWMFTGLEAHIFGHQSSQTSDTSAM